MYYAVWATDRIGALLDRERVREAHRARLRNPGEHKVKVLLGGPTLDEGASSMNGSLLIVEADDIDAVRRFVAEDPYQLAKVYATVEVRPWNWGLGRPETAA
ncbi:MAG: YciI family protein [Burkholderiaceae bacterium]